MRSIPRRLSAEGERFAAWLDLGSANVDAYMTRAQASADLFHGASRGTSGIAASTSDTEALLHQYLAGYLETLDWSNLPLLSIPSATGLLATLVDWSNDLVHAASMLVHAVQAVDDMRDRIRDLGFDIGILDAAQCLGFYLDQKQLAAGDLATLRLHLPGAARPPQTS